MRFVVFVYYVCYQLVTDSKHFSGYVCFSFNIYIWCSNLVAVFGRGNSLKDPASKAYTQVFAPYHGWAIRKAVSAGMYALPTRQQLMIKLNEDGEYAVQLLYYTSDSTKNSPSNIFSLMHRSDTLFFYSEVNLVWLYPICWVIW